ncbi:hypothetical protein BBO99_00006855 [Phytophthora kernoviae]|uniref:Peptidase A1 domain-containing protein n=2 Tax=Phytophthora kernoviae TaxID=325452 RepID=A0A421GK04_9STRA|nr:hypothetical protein BBI17_007298 [Phytophthora kernoviae]RLN77304.1 hypothetical protein BBO99_00006855 [Phytophthora kernoviae]
MHSKILVVLGLYDYGNGFGYGYPYFGYESATDASANKESVKESAEASTMATEKGSKESKKSSKEAKTEAAPKPKMDLIRIPLESDDHLQFVGTVRLGSSRQRFRVVFDTGSSDTWVSHVTPADLEAKSRCLKDNSDPSFHPRYGSGSVSGFAVAVDLRLEGDDNVELLLPDVCVGIVDNKTPDFERLETQVHEFPSLAFDFWIDDTVTSGTMIQRLELQGSDYVRCDRHRRECTAMLDTIQPSEVDAEVPIVVLGTVFLCAYYARFDYTHRQVALACTLDGNGVCTGGLNPVLDYDGYQQDPHTAIRTLAGLWVVATALALLAGLRILVGLYSKPLRLGFLGKKQHK